MRSTRRNLLTQREFDSAPLKWRTLFVFTVNVFTVNRCHIALDITPDSFSETLDFACASYTQNQGFQKNCQECYLKRDD
jgi:hypothetical protein